MLSTPYPGMESLHIGLYNRRVDYQGVECRLVVSDDGPREWTALATYTPTDTNNLKFSVGFFRVFFRDFFKGFLGIF